MSVKIIALLAITTLALAQGSDDIAMKTVKEKAIAHFEGLLANLSDHKNISEILETHQPVNSFKHFVVPKESVDKMFEMLPNLLPLKINAIDYTRMKAAIQTCEGGYVSGEYEQKAGNILDKQSFNTGHLAYFVQCGGEKLYFAFVAHEFTGTYTQVEEVKEVEECKKKYLFFKDCQMKRYSTFKPREVTDEQLALVNVYSQWHYYKMSIALLK